MSYLYQPATLAADTFKLAYSTWFYLPATNGVQLNGQPQSLLSFGLNGIDDLLKASYLQLSGAGGSWLLQAFLFGGAVTNPLPPPPMFGMLNRWLSSNMAVLGAQTHDAWHQLAISWDGSQGVVPSSFQLLSPNPVFSVVLDGVALVGTSSASSPASLSIFDAGRLSSGIYIQGFPVGLPVTTEQVDFPLQFTHEIEFGDTQMWVGRYVDWSLSSNFSNIVRVSCGIGVPAAVSLADAAYGTPAFRFVRDNISGIEFQTNLGTGGSFTVVGSSLIDFTPGPSVDLVE